MRVTVALFGPYARLLPPGSIGGKAVIEVVDGATVASVLDRLDVPESGRRYVTLNGVRQPAVHRLFDGDELRVVVPLGGG